jgi:peptidoglycan/LPS O-acetylase OafA/YrhL
MTEEATFGRIDIKKFYMRRVIRIWPLYFLAVFLAFAILPNFQMFRLPNFGRDVTYRHLGQKLFLYLTIFPNVALSRFGIVQYVSHTWSIGTEEQFYLLWPLLLHRVKKNRLTLMLCVVILHFVVFVLLHTRLALSLSWTATLRGFWSSFNVNCMAIGGVFAVCLFERRRSLSWLRNLRFFYTCLFTLVLLMGFGIQFPVFYYEIYSFLFGVVILNFATNTSIDLSLENRIFRYFGQISFGLYIYHPIAITIAIRIAQQIGDTRNIVTFPICFVTVGLLASFSYRFYESRFLLLRHRFVPR